MTEGEAAPAAASGSDKRNLAMRVAVAVVLIPLLPPTTSRWVMIDFLCSW